MENQAVLNERILSAVRDCIGWIEREMCTYDHAYNGIYERIRIDERHRTNWVRPDCNAEFSRVLTEYAALTGDHQWDGLRDNCVNWLYRMQDRHPLSVFRGSLPFYVVDGWQPCTGAAKSIYQNDNGKTLIALIDMYRKLKDEKYLECAKLLGDYWTRLQQENGEFNRLDDRTPWLPASPCFLAWLAAGLSMLYTEVGETRFKTAAEKAYALMLDLILDNGRIRITYEMGKNEDWRPVSSENGIALLSFSIGYRELKNEKYLSAVKKIGKYLLSLQDESTGAISNCDDTCMEASLQNNREQCDLVYTGGYALMALVAAEEVVQDGTFRTAAIKYAEFLLSIQCRNESPNWDGAWRGSYNFVKGCWEGRCNQNNLIDEGGMYSVYTGWCNTTIMNGLLRLMV